MAGIFASWRLLLLTILPERGDLCQSQDAFLVDGAITPTNPVGGCVTFRHIAARLDVMKRRPKRECVCLVLSRGYCKGAMTKHLEFRRQWLHSGRIAKSLRRGSVENVLDLFKVNSELLIQAINPLSSR